MEQDGRDEAAEEKLGKLGAAKNKAAPPFMKSAIRFIGPAKTEVTKAAAVKEEAKAESISEKQNIAKTTEDAQPDERVSPEPATRQQRNLFMDGFIQRGRQMRLAIDERELEASPRARQEKETKSVKIAGRVEEINQRVNREHQEEIQAAHDQGLQEAMEQELEALEARKKELLARMRR